ncbi:hypothetical protein BWZ22_16300 [Seonamhaeicola sp. S2-3]|uniref:hypothetical protein n=1 Tax=Seonamhaeicola sp. S2-3 TaxID=1936081 RepID=UPI0009727E49|nr:hypothetical protein [Seonamhaeicola sp. S2-3]APY12686.1 hypothetical protein BWZ22_16300 [Seonamhaeicola sp. S2-3]
MHKDVVIKAFEKAQKDIPGKTSITNCSEHISTVLLDELHYQISGKTLRNLYKEATSSGENDININSRHIINLCDYLGYKNYEDFLSHNSSKCNSQKRNTFFDFLKRNKASLIIGFIAVLLAYFITSFNKQRWMIWQDTEYVEVEFDTEKYTLSQLRIYNTDRIDNFKKIEPNCETQFFNEKNEPLIWYGKNFDGTYEYFTGLGKHPQTGKTLKAITVYIIRKYICDTY